MSLNLIGGISNMNLKLSHVYLFIIVLAITSLACQTVMGLVSGEDPLEEKLTSEQEQTESASASEVEQSVEKEPEASIPEDSQSSDDPGEEYRSEEGGYSFATIPHYEVEEFFGVVTMAAPGADPDLGPMFLLIGGLNEEEMTRDQLLDNFIEDSTADPSADITISNRTTINVGEIEGLMADLSGTVDGEAVAGRIVVIMPSPTQQFNMFGFSPADQWDEIEIHFDAVLESITFFEPSEATLDFELEEEPVAEEIRQWASSAEASSEYDSPDWGAIQALGEPDTTITECEDAVTAWASAGSDTVEWLEVGFEGAVIPTEINIIQTHSPDQVVKVEVVDLKGAYTTVYTGEPENLWEDCPYTLTIPVDVDFEVMTVKITIDQSVIDPTWNEIDAVELVGTIAGFEQEAQPVEIDAGTTEGVVWRVGGESGYDEGDFGGLDGLDATADGLVYVTDTSVGVRVLNVESGEQVRLISHEDLWQPTDVQVGPQGNVYVADWGSNEVFIFSSVGDLLTRFGGEGNEPGQFGIFSPESLAISSDGTLFVVDNNYTDAEVEFTRIQVYDSEGNYVREFAIEGDGTEIEEINIGPDGNLFLVDWFEDSIFKYSPQGEFLGTIGEEALEWAGPQDIALDDQGNMYVAIWSPESIMKLDPQGKLIAQFGVEVSDGENSWPEGGFYSLYGVAVLPDGSRVFAADWSGSFSYITAFEYK